MTRSSGCEEGSCEFVPSANRREPRLKRSEDELRYGRLWVEIELPKLLTREKPKREDNKQPQFRVNEL